jgi:raffinose/stachyose/melibiose transport system substrate-binding protein
VKPLAALRAYGGLAILLAAVAASAIRVTWCSLTYEAPGVRTIRICHWQLESGFREALGQLIVDYQDAHRARTGEEVRVLQVPIAERGYRQYVNTGMIGGTAPDIVEKGMAKTAREESYVARFFLPLSGYLEEPNPHNAGTRLEGVPWRDTFIDSLASGYDEVLADYYYIPFSVFTVRIYYNRDLFAKATGSAEPPGSYAGFMEACERLRDYGRRRGEPLAPIAGSRAQMRNFHNYVERPFRCSMVELADANHDRMVDPLEAHLAYLGGRWSFHHPVLQAAWSCMAEIGAQCQEGWLAAQRDDAVFMFAQQRAAMYASGAWDASSIVEQVGSNFEVGVMEFPVPTDHPVYGQHVPGPLSESHHAGGIPWAINARSRDVELCIDFLRFCTTPAGNEQFNNSISWIPVIRGSRLEESLRPFKPRVKGFYGRFDYYNSTAVRLADDGGRWTMYAGEVSPAEHAERLTEVYERNAEEGSRRWLENLRQRGRSAQRALAGLHLQELRGDPGRTAAPAERLQQVLGSVRLIGGQVLGGSARLDALCAEAAEAEAGARP